jgi:uncharacterized delta-60 repeat protein
MTGQAIGRREADMGGTKAVKRGVLTVVGALIAAVVATTAGAATVVSETTWGGADSEVTSGAAVAPDGSSYLAGVTRSFDPFLQEQVFLVKFAAGGSLAWQRTFEGAEQFNIDRANGVAVAPDGAVYVAGQTLGVRGDVLLLKFSPEGSLLWKRSWDGGGTESGAAVAVAADGAVYVTGGTDSFGGFGHLFVLRFAPDGTLVWQRIRDVSTDVSVGTGEGIAVGPDGSVYAAGVEPGAQVGDFNMVLLKLDSQGTLVWQRAYSGGDINDARGGVAVAADGSVYVAGGFLGFTRQTAINDTFVAKFGPDGSLIWDRRYGGDQGDFPGGVVPGLDGTVLVGGESASFGAGSDDAFLLQLDGATGRGVACNSWGGAGLDHGDDVELAPDGTIVLGATTESSPFTLGDCPLRTKRLRGALTTPEIALTDATGVVADPAGTVATPNGTSPGAGGFEAALVRIAP